MSRTTAHPQQDTTPKTGMVSVVVPAWNEAANIPLLLPRLSAVFGHRPWEAIIVDDNSRDGTPAVCAALAAQGCPLRLIVREHPQHGLSGAVLCGISEARGETLVVMDADLQHPPEQIPALLAALDEGADFALGSRYVPGGSTDHAWTLFRRINSGVATVLARPFAGPVRDPMSGFFALHKSTFDRADRLTPLGYKIALELICKCRVNRVHEVPIHFGLRTHGESKLSLAQQFRYLEHLSRLYDFTFPRASPIIKFLIAVLWGLASGVAVFALVDNGSASHLRAMTFGYLTVLLVTAIFHHRYVRTQRPFLVSRHPWRDFFAICFAELLTALLVCRWLDRHAQSVPAMEIFCIGFIAALAVRYVLRKELLHDIRGLRKDLRAGELLD